MPRAERLGEVAVQGNDAAVVLGEVAGGRPLVIEMFATWCEPCRAQIVEVDAYGRKAPGDVLVVAVNVGEDRQTVERFVRRHGVTLPVYRDPDLRFQDSLGEGAVPRLYVVDREGKIVYRGAALDAAARAAIDAQVVLTSSAP
jgi:thiol-disulfide isomerase/thioredoxin